MRHLRLAAGFAAIWVSACASLDPYASSAQALNGYVYPIWNARGKDLKYSTSPEQVAFSKSALQSCVVTLTEGYGDVAGSLSPEVRAAQLIDCMSSAGWEFVLEEVVVTK